MIWAAICAIIYIIFMFIMKGAGLLEITGLRVVNYFVLFLVSFIGIRKWVSQTEHFVPFLTVFLTTLFTGIFSFVLFCIFIMLITLIYRVLIHKVITLLCRTLLLYYSIIIYIIYRFMKFITQFNYKIGKWDKNSNNSKNANQSKNKSELKLNWKVKQWKRDHNKCN